MATSSSEAAAHAGDGPLQTSRRRPSSASARHRSQASSAATARSTGRGATGVRALSSEREQRREQLRETLRLALGSRDVALELRVVRAERCRLEPQPQPGERRPQLVRRVGDELALRVEHAIEPPGHVVEGGGDLRLLRRAGHLGACGRGRRIRRAGRSPRARGAVGPASPRAATRGPGPSVERRRRDRGDGEAVAADARVDRAPRSASRARHRPACRSRRPAPPCRAARRRACRSGASPARPCRRRARPRSSGRSA